MEKKYQGFARVKRQQLQTLCLDFETLKMKLGESVSNYFSQMMIIVSNMQIYRDKTKDITIIEKNTPILYTKIYLCFLCYRRIKRYN